MIKLGISFINEYNIIYATRLHSAILALILGKRVVMIDNSYGKNSCFYNTWLKDAENIELVGHINGSGPYELLFWGICARIYYLLFNSAYNDGITAYIHNKKQTLFQ